VPQAEAREVSEKKVSVIDKTFGQTREIKTECGHRVIVTKWSIRKLSRLSKVIAQLFSRAMDEVTKNSEPDESGKYSFDMKSFVSSLGSLIDVAVDDFVLIICQSCKDGSTMEQIDKEVVLDLQVEDFLDIVTQIIEINLTESLQKKSKALLEKIPFLKEQKTTG
jgi:mRNA-degrading endonuclease RelE of RelBE toxin-antitoxin system